MEVGRTPSSARDPPVALSPPLQSDIHIRQMARLVLIEPFAATERQASAKAAQLMQAPGYREKA
jgi:hypothetical protein